jgi:hypothetical protein
MKNLKIDNIFLKFSPKIELDISTDSFTFRKNGITKKFDTYIYISKDKRQRVISVGEEPLRTFEATKIDLFSIDNNSDSENDKYDCLAAFLSHCIAAMSSKFAMIRPTIIVSGINELNPVLNGYQRKIMMKLLGDAGAIHIIFKD